jgi:glycosyltransferase involved in cell wall biosynthesis
MNKIPIIINNRDLLTWPKAMVERIKGYNNVGEIVIIDNNSTYGPLLEWYATNPCTIHRLDRNVGHAAPWIVNIPATLGSQYYVVTDPDLGLEDTPDDTLEYLYDKMHTLPTSKLGLGLDWQAVLPKSPYFDRLNSHERNRWEESTYKQGVAMDVQIDTTFAMYSVSHYFIGGSSTQFPYVARHYPWEFSLEEARGNEEFMYYMNNATSSSSYKALINP